MQIKLPKSISNKGDRSFALCIELATASPDDYKFSAPLFTIGRMGLTGEIIR